MVNNKEDYDIVFTIKGESFSDLMFAEKGKQRWDMISQIDFLVLQRQET
jgi:hypothetical protein